MQQFATTVGIMLAYWICYGTNFIGGTGAGQSDMAWRTPMIAQGIPAVILSVGVWFLPYSPRWLVNQGRDEEAKSTLSKLRSLPIDSPLVEVEYLEIKSESLFEKRSFATRYPELAAKAEGNKLYAELIQYTLIFRNKDHFKRVAMGSLVMFFQQWSGIDSIIYYAPIVFQSLGLTNNTIALLATGVTGVINVATTIPAVLAIDRVGRKPLLLWGSAGMFLSQLIIGVIVATCQHDWTKHEAAGWGAVVMVWFYIVNFAYSWGPASWTLIAEIFPLSIRAKGASISASSNWMNNFVIAFITPPMLENITYGTYLFFSMWCLIGGLWIFFFFPETKGKTLEQMDEVFGFVSLQLIYANSSLTFHRSTSGSDDIALLFGIQQEVGLIALMQPINVEDKKRDLMEAEHIQVDGGEKV